MTYRMRWRSKTSGKVRDAYHGNRDAADAHFYAILRYADWAEVKPMGLGSSSPSGGR